MPEDEQAVTGDEATQDASQPVAAEPATQAEADDYAELKAALAKEREAAKSAKSEMKKLAGRLAEMENAGKPDLERVTAERDQLRTEYDALHATVREAAGREAVRSKARALGAPDPDLVYRLVRADLEYDGSEPSNVDDLVKAAKVDVPQLFRAVPGGADAGAGNAGTRRATGDWLRTAIAERR